MKKNEKGGAMFEYAMLAALVAVVAIVSVRQFGIRVACTYGFITYAVENPQLSYADARAGQPNMTIGEEVVDC